MKRVKIFFIGLLFFFVSPINVFSGVLFPGLPGECHMVRQRIIHGPDIYKLDRPTIFCVGVDATDAGYLIVRQDIFTGNHITYTYQVATYYYYGRWYVASLMQCQSPNSPGYPLLEPWGTQGLQSLYPNGCNSLTDPTENFGPGCSD
jgi:hypothetical protein